MGVRSRDNYIAYPEGQIYAGLVRMKWNPVRKGDSGGPWYSGGRAVGVTSGDMYGLQNLDFTCALFTPIKGTRTDFGVYINY